MLLTNRTKFDLLIPNKGITLYCSKSNALFRLKYQYFTTKLKEHKKINEFKEWFGNYDNYSIKDQPYVYFVFQKKIENENFEFVFDNKSFQPFKKNLVKQTLIDYLKNKKEILIEPYPIGIDLSIYVFFKSFDSEWDQYTRYDFIIKSNRDEIIFNKTRENVLITKKTKDENSFPDIEFGELKGIEPETCLVRKTKYITQRPIRIIGNKDIRPLTSPSKLSYRKLYLDLKNFYSEYLLKLKSDTLKVLPGGLSYVNENSIGKVYKDSNEMVFKDNNTDINAATGMRNYGHFKSSPIAKDVQFIFIYENSDDANKLYQYLKNGLRHFPGLQSYVGIPPALADLKLKYKKENLKNDFDNFLQAKLPDNNYENYFTIIIGPFKKNNQSQNLIEPSLYYYIKKELLKKGISSQFIFYQNIRSNQFHFFLPNIAIAILAKLGGIPWKLKEQPYKELIIGFNTKKINNQQYIGSSVFFDNQGYIKNVNSYEGNNLTEIIADLNNAIETFRNENPNEELKRIIIHTYKPHGRKERQIEKLLREELQLDIPFIFIEINDSKTTTHICFDENYNYGMPISGTYVRIGANEYLLFNNTRYHENPMRSITEEWPITLRIFANTDSNIDEKQLISQIYEFSRLYWRGLKQKSQPVTTIYSKFVAEYRGNFGEPIPNNKVSQKTPWFL